jgi:polysaccharide export outer membrane protein
MKKITSNLVLLIILFGSLSLSSCYNQRKITYFNGLQSSAADSINKDFHPNQDATVAIGDILSISVSGIDPVAVAPFNLPLVSYAPALTDNSKPAYTASVNDNVNSSPIMQLYQVDFNGDINFPVLGKIRVIGLTKSALIDLIVKKLSGYLRDPLVVVRFMNYKISVIGEVLRPGEYKVDNERITILDALSLAGDISNYGRRDNVLVIRQNGKKMEFGRVNLSSPSAFKSPYYFLQQNDVVCVEPNRFKWNGAQNYALYLSSISTLATVSTSIVYYISLKQNN